jgi:hypothetical protein
MTWCGCMHDTVNRGKEQELLNQLKVEYGSRYAAKIDANIAANNNQNPPARATVPFMSIRKAQRASVAVRAAVQYWYHVLVPLDICDSQPKAEGEIDRLLHYLHYLHVFAQVAREALALRKVPIVEGEGVKELRRRLVKALVVEALPDASHGAKRTDGRPPSLGLRIVTGCGPYRKGCAI